MVVLKLICDQLHLTETELIHAEVAEDGSVSGYAGSDRDFCSVCESSVMTVLEAVEVSDVV